MKLIKVKKGDSLAKSFSPNYFVPAKAPVDGFILDFNLKRVFLSWDDIDKFRESEIDCTEVDSFKCEENESKNDD